MPPGTSGSPPDSDRPDTASAAANGQPPRRGSSAVETIQPALRRSARQPSKPAIMRDVIHHHTALSIDTSSTGSPRRTVSRRRRFTGAVQGQRGRPAQSVPIGPAGLAGPYLRQKALIQTASYESLLASVQNTCRGPST